MKITAALAADLALLSEALDEGDGSLADALAQLVSDVKLAVRSYVGLVVLAGDEWFPLTFTAMDDLTAGGDIATSLLMPLPHGPPGPLAIILFARRAGAFVDLAADLSWLTGRDLGDFVLDRHLDRAGQPPPGRSLRAMSLINQAIGVLIDRGHTPEQAELELRSRAAVDGHDLAAAARSILAALRPGPAGPDTDH